MTNNMEKTELTREQLKKQKKEQKDITELDPKKIRIRLIPIWVRVIIVIFLVALSTIIGAVVGYGVIGDGEIMDTFKKETWQHIIDIVVKE